MGQGTRAGEDRAAMPDILSITAPIYLLMALGFAVVRSGWVGATEMRAVGLFVIRVALPALLFQITASRPLAQILNAPFLLAYGLGSLLAFGAGWWWSRGKPAAERAFGGMGMACSNTGFVGTPVLMHWMGAEGAPALALAFVVENLLMMPLLFTLSEPAAAGRSLGSRLRGLLAPLLRQPMILAILAALLWSALGWSLPGPVARSVDLLAKAAGGAALVVIGGALAGLQRGSMGRDMVAVALGKLLLHPLAVGGALWLCLPAGDHLLAAGIVLAAAPMFSIYPVLAQKHGLEGPAAATLLLATSLSFATLSGVLWALGALGLAG